MEFETAKQSKQHNYRQWQQRNGESEIASELGKKQPQDLEVEEAVLGALMLEKDAYALSLIHI